MVGRLAVALALAYFPPGSHDNPRCLLVGWGGVTRAREPLLQSNLIQQVCVEHA